MDLKRFRKEKGLTQSEMAKIIGLSSNGYKSIENGLADLNINYLITICKHFNISADLLLNLQNNKITISLNTDEAKYLSSILESIKEQLTIQNYKNNITISNNTNTNVIIGSNTKNNSTSKK